MQVHHFPELKEDGVTVTFDRETALVHEDRLFLTWEHPMLSGGMDLLLGSERGNAALSICKVPGLKTGDMLLEVMYNVECVAPATLQIARFLPPSVVRLLINNRGEDLADKFPINQLQGLAVDLGKQTIMQIISSQQEMIRRMLHHAEKHVANRLPDRVTQAITKMQTELETERQRLTALSRINPNVRQEEIDAIQHRMKLLHDYLRTARLHQDAIRLIIAA